MHVVITGANRGIGAGMAAAFAARGDDVTGTSRRGGDLAKLDVTDPAQHEAFAASLGDRAVDLLVCNAGVYLDKGHTLESGYDAALWAETFAANVTGVFLTIRALLPALERSAQPKIAIISSQMASQNDAPGGSYIYRASKAAALNLGRNLATDLRPRGIVVGIYHPGWVRTDMGGGSASIDVEESVSGLIARFDELAMPTTGAFLNWDGRPHVF